MDAGVVSDFSLATTWRPFVWTPQNSSIHRFDLPDSFVFEVFFASLPARAVLVALPGTPSTFAGGEVIAGRRPDSSNGFFFETCGGSGELYGPLTQPPGVPGGCQYFLVATSGVVTPRTPEAVPEPATILLLLGGAGASAVWHRRSR
jgi:hypothetical protein